MVPVFCLLNMGEVLYKTVKQNLCAKNIQTFHCVMDALEKQIEILFILYRYMAFMLFQFLSLFTMDLLHWS